MIESPTKEMVASTGWLPVQVTFDKKYKSAVLKKVTKNVTHNLHMIAYNCVTTFIPTNNVFFSY